MPYGAAPQNQRTYRSNHASPASTVYERKKSKGTISVEKIFKTKGLYIPCDDAPRVRHASHFPIHGPPDL